MTHDKRNGTTKKIKMLGEKETYKQLGILEAEATKQVGWGKKKVKKNFSGEREIYSKPN